MKPNLGLPDAHREGVLRILNALLADEYLLLTRTRGYRWNVVGLQFGILQRSFGEQVGELDGVVDLVAGRIRALGGVAPGTLLEFVQQSFKASIDRRTSELGWNAGIPPVHFLPNPTLAPVARKCLLHDLAPNVWIRYP